LQTKRIYQLITYLLGKSMYKFKLISLTIERTVA